MSGGFTGASTSTRRARRSRRRSSAGWSYEATAVITFAGPLGSEAVAKALHDGVIRLVGWASWKREAKPYARPWSRQFWRYSAISYSKTMPVSKYTMEGLWELT